MKTLLFLRHGKSDWGAEYDEDHDRPLNRRGQRAASTMGRFLTAMELVPDVALTSTATRAHSTVELAAVAGGWPAPIRTMKSLYDASPDSVLEVLRHAPNEADCLLLAGHEPTWSMTIEALAGGGAVRFPTAAVARVTAEIESWSELEFGAGVLHWLVTPKLLQKIGWDEPALRS